MLIASRDLRKSQMEHNVNEYLYIYFYKVRWNFKMACLILCVPGKKNTETTPLFEVCHIAQEESYKSPAKSLARHQTSRNKICAQHGEFILQVTFTFKRVVEVFFLYATNTKLAGSGLIVDKKDYTSCHCYEFSKKNNKHKSENILK